MLPAYQNASLNKDLAIKKQLVQIQKRAYSVVQDTQLIQDTGLASQMNSAIQTNLVTLEALLAEASAHYSAYVMNADITDLDITLVQQGYVDKSLASSMKSIMITANQLKQNVSKLQPVINYLNKGDIANLLQQLEQVNDRYTDIFTTAQDITSLNLEAHKEDILTKFLEQTEKSIQPVYDTLNTLLQAYSPAGYSVPLPQRSQGRNPDGGYNLAGVMASNSM